MNRNALAMLGMIVACILWGSSHAVAKTALNEAPPFLLAALRLCIAAPLFILIQMMTRRPPIHTEDRWPLVRLSMIGIVASFILAYSGIRLTLSSDSSLLIVGEVIFTAIFAYVLLRERITRNRLIGLLVGTAGVVILITGAAGQNTETAPNRLLGNILVLGCLACESYYTVRGAAYLERNNSISMLAWVNTASLVVWIPVLAYYGYTGELAQLSAAAWGASVYMAVVTSVVCYFLWFNGVRIVGATVAAVALLFQPVVGALVGIQVMGDPVTLTFIIGGILVVGALLISGIPERKSAPSDAV